MRRDGKWRAGVVIARPMSMWILLGILLFVGWVLGKLVWNVASFGIHLLLALAIVSVIVHFVAGRRGYRGATAAT